MDDNDNRRSILDRILLIIAACAVLGIVALVDWRLETVQLSSAWRDYLIYNACVWFALCASLWTRMKVARFRALFLGILIFHWALSAVLTHFGASFLWSGLLALCEIHVLHTYGGQTSAKRDFVPTHKD